MKKYLLKIIGTMFMITSFYQNITYADTLSPGEVTLSSFALFLPIIAIGVILVSIISIIILNYIAKEDETKKSEIKGKQNKIVKRMIVLLIICVALFGLIGSYFLIRNSSGPDTVDMTEALILSFNAKFTRYEGRIRGSQVNELAQVVISNNNNQKEYGYTNCVEMKGEINIKKDSTNFEKLDISKYYTVTLSYQNGMVNEITVTENKESINN